MDLKGKIVFVTGAAQGIGRALAEALLGKGCKVAIGDVNSTTGSATLKDFEKRFGKDNVRFIAFDVSKMQAFKDAFKKVLSEFGGLNIMVNCAGILNEFNWESVININYTGVVTGTKLATDHMNKLKGGCGGRIINLSSVAGLDNFYCAAVYTGTKHAITSFTSSLAAQPNIEQQGIEYGVLCPNAVATAFISNLSEATIHFMDDVKKLCANPLQVSTVVEAFLELLQLPKMNGSILLINPDGRSYRKVEHKAVE